MRQLFSSIPGQVLDFIVVLIGLIIIFKSQLTTLVTNTFSNITNRAGTL